MSDGSEAEESPRQYLFNKVTAASKVPYTIIIKFVMRKEPDSQNILLIHQSINSHTPQSWHIQCSSMFFTFTFGVSSHLQSIN